jgi:hypothetical protein
LSQTWKLLWPLSFGTLALISDGLSSCDSDMLGVEVGVRYRGKVGCMLPVRPCVMSLGRGASVCAEEAGAWEVPTRWRLGDGVGVDGEEGSEEDAEPRSTKDALWEGCAGPAGGCSGGWEMCGVTGAVSSSRGAAAASAMTAAPRGCWSVLPAVSSVLGGGAGGSPAIRRDLRVGEVLRLGADLLRGGDVVPVAPVGRRVRTET